ncbi:hypothetical protein L7F22_041629 [Adiantum nelumboides]|nr:hypothetical protein [Adiantum nelumboides]
MKCSTTNLQDREGLVLLFLCPTRELAEQVFRVAKSICHHAQFRVTLIDGDAREEGEDEDAGAEEIEAGEEDLAEEEGNGDLADSQEDNMEVLEKECMHKTMVAASAASLLRNLVLHYVPSQAVFGRKEASAKAASMSALEEYPDIELTHMLMDNASTSGKGSQPHTLFCCRIEMHVISIFEDIQNKMHVRLSHKAISISFLFLAFSFSSKSMLEDDNHVNLVSSVYDDVSDIL